MNISGKNPSSHFKTINKRESNWNTGMPISGNPAACSSGTNAMQKTTSMEAIDPGVGIRLENTLEKPLVPQYLEETYWWAYLHPVGVRFFERQWLVNLILWGNFSRLRNAALDEIGEKISGRILQVACVYGDFSSKLADRLTPASRLDVVDVAPIQLENLARKTSERNNIFMHHQDASALLFESGSFDHVVLFFLLHELPADVRRETVREALRVVKPGGKVVFVDYHRPESRNPHRFIMPPILKTLEPFAMDLWDNEIVDWMPKDVQPQMVEKTTYFGGLYQKVVITR